MYVSMKGMLKRANEGNYAVMAINCFNIETARAVINAAQSLRAPIIINIVQEHMVNHCDSNLIAPIVKKLAQRASVEVALNFDHGEEIGLLKKEKNVAILQNQRWNEILGKMILEGEEKGLSNEFVMQLFKAIHQESITHQEKVINK